MTFPDFSTLPLSTPSVTGASPTPGEPWQTPEGIPVKTAYTASDTAPLDHLDDFPGLAPFGRGPYPTM